MTWKLKFNDIRPFDLILGHQFDPRIKILLAFCSAPHLRRFDMLHDHVQFFFYPLGTPSAHSSPGADFCTGLSFWLGTTYLPEKVWLQKCNPGVFCNTARYVAQLNCGSSFAVGRHLWTYPTLNEAWVNWEENTPHVQPLLPIQHISL